MANKVPQSAAMYFSPAYIGEKEGAHCDKCMMFFKEGNKGQCTVVEGDINGPNGVCGLYVHGKHQGPTMKGTMDKETASYADNGPTHCGNCKFYLGNKFSGECEIVEGIVEFLGCCNGWQEGSSPKNQKFGKY